MKLIFVCIVSNAISRSTLKRICRKLGIRRWPSYKRKKIKSGSGTSISEFIHGFADHQQPEMLLESFANEKSSTGEEDVRDPSKALRSPNLAVNQEKAVTNVATAPCERALSISARYQHKTMKFPLTKTGLEQKLAEMLRLKLGTFMIKYLDTENDWILIACDGDLKDLTVVACDGTIHMIDCPSKSIICKNSSEFDA
ncbi:hypothetical protein M9H77_03969 [Catharanthus roseus]|uniref:Uncharacterized protein n=1 Tax=Catharanthus roseus TaxID=4058 RepID=A0ACC0CCU5_CATRO|nr:hypothetical protein M9H77_03969 [Catharanthus roseus]